MNEPRVYRQSPFQFIDFSLIALVVLGVIMLLPILQGNLYRFLMIAVVVGAFIFSAIYSMSSTIIVSDLEIASKQFRVTHSLNWSEIQQISGNDSGLKLKNIIGDVTVALNSQTPGYEEVIRKIGEKRPDLFISPEFTVMESSPAGIILSIIMILTTIGYIGYIILQDNAPWVLLFVIPMIIISVATTLLGSPQSVIVEGSSLFVTYLFREPATYRADEIESVDLNYQRTGNGRIYFIKLSLKNKKPVRISGLKPGAAVTYLVLKEWHKKQTASKLSV